MISFKGRHFNKEMILQSIRWTLAYSLSYRDIEEMMQERGFAVDHSTIHRWVIHYTLLLEKIFHLKKKRPNGRWRMDESVLQLSCVEDEGRPFEIALQEEISNHPKLLW